MSHKSQLEFDSLISKRIRGDFDSALDFAKEYKELYDRCEFD
jgi:hypothetical protein